MTIDRMQAMQALERLRFADMVALALPCSASVHEAADLIAPLLSRRLRFNWAQLVSETQSADDVVRLARQLADALAGCERWNPGALELLLDEVTPSWKPGQAAARSAISVCLLFEPSPLPLAPVIDLLGRAECVRRLRTVADALSSMQMVG